MKNVEKHEPIEKEFTVNITMTVKARTPDEVREIVLKQVPGPMTIESCTEKPVKNNLIFNMTMQEELDKKGGRRIWLSTYAELPNNSRNHAWKYTRMTTRKWYEQKKLFSKNDKAKAIMNQCVAEAWQVTDGYVWVKSYKSMRKDKS